MTRDLLANLASEDSDAVCAGLGQCTAVLRGGDAREDVISSIGERLVALAEHSDRQVRRGVAAASAHLPDTYFERIIPRLAKDRNSLVSAAAERALKMRSATRRVNVVLDDQAASIKKLRSDIEREHGKKARRDAQRLADRSTEFFAQKLNHEFKKVAATLQIAVANLRSAAQRPDFDRDPMLDNASAASAALHLLLSVVSTACDIADLVPSKFKPENVRSVVVQAVALLRDRFDAKRLDVEVEIDDAIVVDADRGKLLQALSNVLQNAAESYPPDRARIPIHIAAKNLRGGTQVVLSVADEGCGIGAEELPHAFAPFGTSKPGVRGLGLLNVQKMIESVHGGSVDLVSEKGVGTTVTLTLPRKQKA